MSPEPSPAAPVASEPQPADAAAPAATDAVPHPEPETPAPELAPEPLSSAAPPNPDVAVKEEKAKPTKQSKSAKASAAHKDPDKAEPDAAGQAPTNKRWYAVKVQSGREESIKDAIERRVKIEGLEEYFGQILIPVERVQEIKSGKRVVKERKKFPGYLMAEVEYNDRILYLFRETSGVGDFVGGDARGNRPPPPLPQREIDRMLGGPPGKDEGKAIPEKPAFEKGDRVKVKDGIFAGMEGEVKDILEAKGQVRVELTIFGRPTSVELEYWQVEQL
jgi:transcriptional antiterminator NusG